MATTQQQMRARRKRQPKAKPRTLPPPAIPSHRALELDLRRISHAARDAVKRAIAPLLAAYAVTLREDAPTPTTRRIRSAMRRAQRIIDTDAKRVAERGIGEVAVANVRAANDQLNALPIEPGQTVSLRRNVFTVDKALAPVVRQHAKELTKRIVTIPEELLGHVERTLVQSMEAGDTVERIGERLQDLFGISDRYARTIARTTVLSTNAALTQARDKDLGIERYVWTSSQDERVRPRHRQLNGHVIRWDDPPVVDLATGRRAHAGFDFSCRCVPTAIVQDVADALDALGDDSDAT